MVNESIDSAREILPLIVYGSLSLVIYPSLIQLSLSKLDFPLKKQTLLAFAICLPVLPIIAMPFILAYIWTGCGGCYITSLVLLSLATVFLLLMELTIFLTYSQPNVRNWYLRRDIEQTDVIILKEEKNNTPQNNTPQ